MKDNSEMNQNRGRRSAVIIIIIIAFAAVPLLLFRNITNSIVERITQTISLQYSQELNAQMSSHMSAAIDYYYHELNTEYNALKLVEDLDEEKLQRFIKDTQESNNISYLAFVDESGFVYESDGSYLGTMRIPMMGDILVGTDRLLTDNVTIGNNSYIMVGASFDEPVCMGESKLCAALLGMDNDDLCEHISLQSDYSGGYSSIIHRDGGFVVKNTAEVYGGLNIFSILEKYYNIGRDELDTLKEAVSSGKSYMLHAVGNESRDSIYLYFAPIENTEWYIANTLPSSFIKSSIVDLRDSIEKVYIIFIVFFLTVAALIIIQQSVSRHKIQKSQEQLERALRFAEEASGAKTSFLFSMSHDIRTPMNAILGYTDIGLKHVDDTELSRDSYEKIKMAGGHLLNLINDILEMSRIESGKMELVEKPLDIRKAISEVNIMSHSLADARNIDYETIIDGIRNPYIYADELHINQVIINIISNAVKYTPEGGKVRYTISQTGDAKDGKITYRFEVADNGIGMSEEFQKHLFETFSREENTTISKTEGTGLGLSIVKKIVDMAGGNIKVDSVRGRGSVFTVDIPFRVQDEEAVQKFIAENKSDTEISPETNLEGKKVLLTEDNDLNREIATFVLEEAGLIVDSAENGEIAVSTVIDKGTDYYDFILMDIQMPVMDGYEATSKIRSLSGGDRIPIIALSANAFEEDKQKSSDAGMDAHVAKPIDTRILLDTMSRLKR